MKIKYTQKTPDPFGSYVMRSAIYYGEDHIEVTSDQRFLLLWFLVNTKPGIWEWAYIGQYETKHDKWKESPQGMAYQALSTYTDSFHKTGIKCKVLVENCTHCGKTKLVEVFTKEFKELPLKQKLGEFIHTSETGKEISIYSRGGGSL